MLTDSTESAVPRKKYSETYLWFENHFVKCSQAEYLNRSPFIIIQGPTGSAKTSTLKKIAKDLNIPIKEFNELTDTTAITNDVAKLFDGENGNSRPIEQKKAAVFQSFVINSLYYNPLYPVNEAASNNADSEMSSDDEFYTMPCSRPPKPPMIKGIIIHVDTPLGFARSQRILVNTVVNITKKVREISRRVPRRIAVVIETLDGDMDSITLPSKLRVNLGIEVIKFNPITKATMKKIIDIYAARYINQTLDREFRDQIVEDSAGDLRACINTLEFVCNKFRRNSLVSDDRLGISLEPTPSSYPFPQNKKQKTCHNQQNKIDLYPNLLRDGAKNVAFFHLLGKIFYQKRKYPEKCNYQPKSPFDRPYPTENETDSLADMVACESKNLTSWLHQHYYRFCSNANVEKASLFLDYLSLIDTISISSTQSTQFYEHHSIMDQIQTHLSIQATTFSLYEDQSTKNRSNQKKVFDIKGNVIIKSSVESLSDGSNGDMQGFTKPTLMSVPRVIEDSRILLNYCASTINDINSRCPNSAELIRDYVPYLVAICKSRQRSINGTRASLMKNRADLFSERMIEVLTHLDVPLNSNDSDDYDLRHETMEELIEGLTSRLPLEASQRAN